MCKLLWKCSKPISLQETRKCIQYGFRIFMENCLLLFLLHCFSLIAKFLTLSNYTQRRYYFSSLFLSAQQLITLAIRWQNALSIRIYVVNVYIVYKTHTLAVILVCCSNTLPLHYYRTWAHIKITIGGNSSTSFLL